MAHSARPAPQPVPPARRQACGGPARQRRLPAGPLPGTAPGELQMSVANTALRSGERRAESGERRAESGERRAESGERRAESGERRAESAPALPPPGAQLPFHTAFPKASARREGPRPTLGGRIDTRGRRFIPKAPDSGCAARHIAIAPSRGEGRARPGRVARAKGKRCRHGAASPYGRRWRRPTGAARGEGPPGACATPGELRGRKPPRRAGRSCLADRYLGAGQPWISTARPPPISVTRRLERSSASGPAPR